MRFTEFISKIFIGACVFLFSPTIPKLSNLTDILAVFARKVSLRRRCFFFSFQSVFPFCNEPFQNNKRAVELIMLRLYAYYFTTLSLTLKYLSTSIHLAKSSIFRNHLEVRVFGSVIKQYESQLGRPIGVK